MGTLRIDVNHDFELDAGDVTTAFEDKYQRDVYTITPPSKSMFEQTADYLFSQPRPTSIGLQARYLGVAFVALTVRWSSYLAALMNPYFPPHPQLPKGQNTLQPQHISFITDGEMRRLNLEISSNIAELGRMYRNDMRRFYDLLDRAYEYLPMPAKTTRPNRELENNLFMAYAFGSIYTYAAKHPDAIADMRAAGLLLDNFDFTTLPIEMISFDDADRIIGNFLTNFAWRNTEVETYHAGGSVQEELLLPHQRRFTECDERRLLRELCSNGAVVARLVTQLYVPSRSLIHPADKYLARYPETAFALYNTHWKWFYSYPKHWSATDRSSIVRL